MEKEPSFGPDFGHFGPNLGPKNFVGKFYLYWMLEIVVTYNFMQFKRKLINQTWKNDKIPSFGPDLGPFVPNSGRENFFSKIWLRQSQDIIVSYHHVQYQRKIN